MNISLQSAGQSNGHPATVVSKKINGNGHATQMSLPVNGNVGITQSHRGTISPLSRAEIHPGANGTDVLGVEATANNDALILEKLRLARQRGFFRTIDLFAGCGGMTLGFHRAGFRCVSAIELNENARASHELNFSGQSGEYDYAAFADIKKIEPFAAVGHIEPILNEPTRAIDIVIGGPPCQAFSRLGRAALWNLAGKKFAHGEDERATMYHYFLRYVAMLKPIAFVMENVREIGKHVGKNIAEEIAVTTEAMGYETRYTLLNAVWYGVPQLRERMFIIGIHRSLQVTPSFPLIQHLYELPVGYSTSRAGEGEAEVCPPSDHYIDHHERSKNAEQAVTISQAFADLPPIFEHLDGRPGKGFRRRTESPTPYANGGNDFTNEMRSWPGFSTEDTAFTGHVIRYTPRDYETFRRMPHGGMYPEALQVANAIFQERVKQREAKLGRIIRKGSKEWDEIHRATVPPYKDGRYPNKFRKLWPDHPSRTLPAHIGKDSYSHIHYDSAQARGISLREGARIQSFPDAFKLAGSMNSQLTQIGNAVPPLLAYAVAKQLKRSLRTSHSYATGNKRRALQTTGPINRRTH